MSKEAMKLALEALLHCKDAIVERGLNGSPEFAEKWGLTLPLERADQAITALREALAQERSSDEQPAQQEPVACVQDLDEVKRKHLVYEKGMEWKDPLYASPPAQRKSLTDEEWQDFSDRYGLIIWGPFKREIEAKLKEKNSGD